MIFVGRMVAVVMRIFKMISKDKACQFDAVVFDMDGVILDSEQLVYATWQELGEKYGFELKIEDYRKCLGVTKTKAEEIMKECLGEDFPYQEYSKEASKIFHERYDGGNIPLKKGVVELLEGLKTSGKLIALATSTRRESATKELSDVGLLKYFDKVICGDDINKSKPDPDIYLMACEALGVEPACAVGIEDSYNGIRSSNSAGLMTIMVPDMIEPNAEIMELCHKVFNDLIEVKGYLGV